MISSLYLLLAVKLNGDKDKIPPPPPPPELPAANREIGNPALSDVIANKTGASVINFLLGNFITLLFVIASLAAFFLLLIGAIQFITSGGDKARLEAAQNKITHAIIGLVLVFSLYAILSLIGNFLGLNLTLFDINKLML